MLQTTERISVNIAGTQGNAGSFNPGLSGDGRFAAFASDASNLVLADTNATTDVFVAELAPVENGIPVANAGKDRRVAARGRRAAVRLDGSESSDPDADPLTFVWTEGEQQLASGPKPRVRLPRGRHVITLTVTDSQGASDTDEVVITVVRRH
jgi:hypothetical protein